MIFDETVISTLRPWVNFYVIIGSSAGALTGLQFVVMSLIAEGEATGTMQGIRVFGTPTVVHFCAALLISSILSMPWHGLFGLSLVLGMCGATGVAYLVRIIWHARRQTAYKPVAEDWVWYGALPLLTYTALLLVALELRRHTYASLFAIAAIALSLLFIGIHNSWDTVIYLAIKNQQETTEKKS